MASERDDELSTSESDSSDETFDEDNDVPSEDSGEADSGIDATEFDEDSYQVSHILEGRGSKEFLSAAYGLGESLGATIFLVVLGSGRDASLIDNQIAEHVIQTACPTQGLPVVVILDTLGGDGRGAYRTALALRQKYEEFLVIVPRLAKSAGTILALGASDIVLGTHAELGPLDVQIYDDDRGSFHSALNEVQAVERLYSIALDALDQAVTMLMFKTRSRPMKVLEPAMSFVTDLTAPMMNSIDVVRYSERSRALKVGEDYAMRLLQPKYDAVVANAFARSLVNNYSDHGFPIDHAEIGRIQTEISSLAMRLGIAEPPPLVCPLGAMIEDVRERIDDLYLMMGDFTAVGWLSRVNEEMCDGAAEE